MLWVFIQTKRGDNDLKLLQSSVKLASDINALYLEEMKESLPRFAEAKDKSGCGQYITFSFN